MKLWYRGYRGWILVGVLLVAGLLLALQASAAGSRGAISGGQVDRRPRGMAAPVGIEAFEQPSQTVYLPVVYRAPAPYRPFSFGVQLYGIYEETTIRATETGAGWVRMPLSWADIEPQNTTPDRYRWSPGLEAELRSYAGKGVRVIFTLTSNPQWAADFPGGPVYDEAVGELVEFTQAVVARYGAAPYNVKHWEMYNEPDNGDLGYALAGWGYFGHNPEAYVDLLETVYQPIKEVDPEAHVLFGGLAYDWWEEPFDGPFVESFLDDVLALMQGRDSYPFDMMNFHYYPAFASNWEEYDLGIDIIGKAEFIRLKLAEYGADKPLICTESGVRSDCPQPEVETQCGSDEEQSRYVVQVYTRGQAADLGIGIWFMLVDPSAIEAPKDGLVDADLDPKRSYSAYQTLAAQLSAADYVRTLALSATGSGQIEAYEFVDEGSGTIIVAWTNDESNHTMGLAGSCLTITDKYGVEGPPACDGDDGEEDGVIQVSIGPSPVHLRLR